MTGADGGAARTANAAPPHPEPAVSVVIPTFDRRVELEACLEALVAQTSREFEVIVVDDGSTDGTEEMVRGFSTRAAPLPIRYLSNGGNLGANVARNRGVREARGESVAFLDSDCRPAPLWLGILRAALDDPMVTAVTGLVTNPPPRNLWELAYSGTSRVHGAVPNRSDASGASPGTHRAHRESGPGMSQPGTLEPTATLAGRIVAGNLAVRRDFLLANPFEEDIKYGCNEEGLFLRLSREGRRVVFEPRAVVVHDHPYDRQSFLARGRILGAAAAWFVYKYRLPPRLDVLPFIAAAIISPASFLGSPWGLVPSGFLLVGIAGLLYAERWRKGKSWGDSLRSLPALLAFYVMKSGAYAVTAVKLRLGSHGIERAGPRSEGDQGREARPG